MLISKILFLFMKVIVKIHVIYIKKKLIYRMLR